MSDHKFTHANNYEEAVAQYSVEEWLTLLAEEADELGKAALKYRRAIKKDGFYTPVTPEEASANLIEEFCDVLGCMRNVVSNHVLTEAVMGLSANKHDRFVVRHNKYRANYEEE